MTFIFPEPDCSFCPRLAEFRESNRLQYPHYFNAPVPSFGELDAELLVVGLAPGLKGANRTGRPFTGDYAGLVLYAGLQKYGFAHGPYDPEKVAAQAKPKGGHYDHSADGFKLTNCRITNAVRCVPQENKPEPSEIKQCNAFLKKEIAAMPNLKVILSLGLVSHKAVLMALGLKQSAFTFGHGAVHKILIGGRAAPDSAPQNLPRGVVVKDSSTTTVPLTLIGTYHSSRYNINTGRLTKEMFDKVIARAGALVSL